MFNIDYFHPEDYYSSHWPGWIYTFTCIAYPVYISGLIHPCTLCNQISLLHKYSFIPDTTCQGQVQAVLYLLTSWSWSKEEERRAVAFPPSHSWTSSAASSAVFLPASCTTQVIDLFSTVSLPAHGPFQHCKSTSSWALPALSSPGRRPSQHWKYIIERPF